jgi:tricorn protease
MKVKQIGIVTAALLCTAVVCSAQGEKPLLMREPTVNATQIVFAYAGDLWRVPRTGGEAIRLTSSIGIESDPCFSPDGKEIAFTGQYDGNTDVYVMPAAGGEPRRLTWHPAGNAVCGWTPDGRKVLFTSNRASEVDAPKLFTIPKTGGVAEPLPLPAAASGAFAPDGKRLAYIPNAKWQNAWKRYRGGQTTPLWIADLDTSKIIEKIPRTNTNDSSPMWAGDKLYFLSDRNGPVTLFTYDLKSKKVAEAVHNTGLDVKSASIGPGAIVYEQFGGLSLYTLADGKSHKVNVQITSDFPQVRPHYVKVNTRIQGADISPNGARAVFEAHGDIFTIPAEKGDARNLTNTPGVAERSPSWSPDGKSLAYFCDESGEYALHIRSQDGKGETRKIALGVPGSFFYNPVWSPDSKKIAFTDKRSNTWFVELAKGMPVKITANPYGGGGAGTPVWSPNSQWIVYAKTLPSRLNQAFAYELAAAQSHAITDGLSDVNALDFDKSGKYLYLTASVDAGPNAGGFDMSGYERPVTRNAYIIVLRNDVPSPLSPESDEEKPKPDEKPAAAEKPDDKDKPTDKDKSADKAAKEKDKDDKPFRIDFDGILQRTLALPIPTRNFGAITAGKEGVLFLLETPQMRLHGSTETPILHRFDLSTRKVESFLTGVESYAMSANREKLLYRQGSRWAITPTATAAPAAGTLNLADMQVLSDPKAEWSQMYHEVWRIERDWFYATNYHGLDLKATAAKYEPYLQSVQSRADLNYLFEEMLGELTVGHMFIGGGDQPSAPRVQGGLLGADYTVENGRYRFARIYNGENWNPDAHAPLTQPGVQVKVGEYLLKVNGQDVLPTREVSGYFEATAGKQTVLQVGPSPDGVGSREVTVVPVSSEHGLRYLAWIEDNRRKVDQLSGGKIAYVHVPDTGEGGYTSFNRYFFAQVGREGIVVDERFNHGGSAADYILDYLRRTLMSYFLVRDGEDLPVPQGAIFGPKAMIINEYAGSGGDLMPWMFRKSKLGPLIGKRTWGGLVGIGGYPILMDGGSVNAPHFAFWNPNGTWDVENHGVDPDIEVEWDPALWRAGHDPQLEKAVEVVLDELKKHPLPKPAHPAFPNYQRK